jgi:hypothetical protein
LLVISKFESSESCLWFAIRASGLRVTIEHRRTRDDENADGQETVWNYPVKKKSLLQYIAVPCIRRFMKLEKELVAASSVPFVLSILSEGDSYGYAIIQRVKELSGGKIEWTDGMLYPVLHWLEDRRMVRSRWEKADSGRKRKYYSLQPEGHQALRQQKEQWKVVTSALNQIWRPQHA